MTPRDSTSTLAPAFEGIRNCACPEPVLQAKDLSFRYPGGPLVLESVSLHLDRGLFLGVIGPNGGGKSTLVRLIAGEFGPTSGTLSLWGSPVRSKAVQEKIGYVPQFHGGDWDFPSSMEEVVLMGAIGQRGLLGRIPKKVRESFEHLVELVGLKGKEREAIGNLSGGQRQRAFIAQALIRQPELLLLDEPTTGIDSQGQEQFIELIRKLKDTLDLTVVMVSHDIGQLARFTDRIACLNRRIHWHDQSEFLSDEVIQTVYQCELHSIQEHSHKQWEETHIPHPHS